MTRRPPHRYCPEVDHQENRSAPTATGRAAATPEVAAWVEYLNGGGTGQGLEAGLIASYENLNLGAHGNLPLWVADSYQKALGRPAAPGEVNTWLTVLGAPPVSAPAAP